MPCVAVLRRCPACPILAVPYEIPPYVAKQCTCTLVRRFSIALLLGAYLFSTRSFQRSSVLYCCHTTQCHSLDVQIMPLQDKALLHRCHGLLSNAPLLRHCADHYRCSALSYNAKLSLTAGRSSRTCTARRPAGTAPSASSAYLERTVTRRPRRAADRPAASGYIR